MSKWTDVISYTGENGYRGLMYGKSYMAVCDYTGVVYFHTNSREINTMEDLKKFVDGFDEFISNIERR